MAVASGPMFATVMEVAAPEPMAVLVEIPMEVINFAFK